MENEIFEKIKRASHSSMLQVVSLPTVALLLGLGGIFSDGFIKFFLTGVNQGNSKSDYFLMLAIGAVCFVIYYLLVSFLMELWKLSASCKDEHAQDGNVKEEKICSGDDEEDNVDDATCETCEKPTNIFFLKQEGNVKKGEAILKLMAKASGNSFEHIIKDPLGIHARPAGAIAQLVKDLDCKVTIKCEDKTALATSILELMKLGASHGSKIEVFAEGEDKGKALQSLKSFMDAKL